MSDLYSKRAEEKRRQFNSLINKIDMVLMNAIDGQDYSIWENWLDKSPIDAECDIEESAEQDNFKYQCNTHGIATNDEFECEEYNPDPEIYQWFAINEFDAKFLADHNQYVTSSDMLDTYFLAIAHFGTAWDYTSMVDDFEDMYRDLDKFNDKEEA